MILQIANQTGRIHYAAQQSSLQKTRPCYAFVPEEFFEEGGFQKHRYLASRWPSINCTSNTNAIGSHVIPDSGKPVSPRSRCPVLREFKARLKIVAAIKTIQINA